MAALDFVELGHGTHGRAWPWHPGCRRGRGVNAATVGPAGAAERRTAVGRTGLIAGVAAFFLRFHLVVGGIGTVHAQAGDRCIEDADVGVGVAG